jgi:hypothetical protein
MMRRIDTRGSESFPVRVPTGSDQMRPKSAFGFEI